MREYPDAQEVHRTSKKSVGTNRKQFIVIHYTAGASTDSAVQTLAYSSAKVSCQFVVGREGEVHQIGSVDDIQWHAGTSKWAGINGLNRYSVGIEMVNPGWLEKVNENTYQTYYGKRYNVEADGLILSKHKTMGRQVYGWLPYTSKQLLATEALTNWLIDEYPSFKEVVGHEQISPGRKQDPAIGIIFPQKMLDKMNARINGNDRFVPGVDDTQKSNEKIQNVKTSGNYRVNVKNKLNVRGWPSMSSKTISQVSAGDIVLVDRVLDDWSHIPSTNGWVYSAYLERV